MLNLQEIARIIEGTFQIESHHLDDLFEMKNKYPYAQLFPILYLKSLAELKDVRFEEALEKNAYLISDRTQLYNLLNVQSVAEYETTSQEIESPELENREVDTQKDDELLSENLGYSKIENTTSNLAEEVEEELDTRPHEQEKNILPEIKSFGDFEDELDGVVIPLKIGSIEEKVDSSKEQKLSLDLETEKKEIVKNESSQEFEVEIKSTDDVKALEREIIAHAISSNYNLDHLEDISDNEKVELNALPSNAIKKSFVSWLQSNTEVYLKVKDEKERVQELLNKFIIEEPKVAIEKKKEETQQQKKKEFFSPLKQAKESLNEEVMPVSETLAKIFAIQGNFPKAIYSYEQLMLIYP